MIVHQRAGELDQERVCAGEFVDGGVGAKRFDDFRRHTDFMRANLVARPGVMRASTSRAAVRMMISRSASGKCDSLRK